jgi:hypothetical protein
LATRSVDISAVYELLYDPQYKPERSPNSHIDKILIDSKPSFVLINEVTQDYFEVDEVTAKIWDLMDGTRNLRQIYEEAKKIDPTLVQKDVKDVLVSLAEQGTVKTTEPEMEEKRIELVSASQLNVRLVKDSSKSLARFFKFTNRVLKPWQLYVAIGIIAIGATLSATKFFPLLTNKSNFAIAGSTLVGLLFYELVVLLPVYIVHELAHGSVCAYYGGKPKALGTGLYYFAPFFYCDTSDAWRLSKKARIMISLAGPISTLVLGTFMVIGTYFVPPGFGNHVLLLAQYLCFYGTLINFSPVIETDGYYALMDLTNIPNLRDESFSYLKKLFYRHVLGRQVSLGHITSKIRRLMLIYSLGSFAWIVFFAYTTLTMTYYYSQDAFKALVNLVRMVTLTSPFSLVVIAISLASVCYYGLVLLGYGIMGKSAYDKARIRGIKLETIHDKRVAIFLPLPSSFPKEEVDELVGSIKATTRKYSPASSVSWEPPICVAVMKLGKVDESLEQIRHDMQKVEKSFRSHYRKFLSEKIALDTPEVESFAKEKKDLSDLLKKLANQFPSFEREEARREVWEFLKRRHSLVLYLLHSAFGSVWTLELSPEDYRKTEREIFPNLIAEDLSVTDLYGELEQFKKHTVLGLETIARLSVELEREASEVFKRHEKYQATAFIEPIKSRLVFVGRTEKIAESLKKLGGLFTYQTWGAYISHVLDEASLGLMSVRRAPSYTMGKVAIAKLHNNELFMLKEDLDSLDEITQTVRDSICRVNTTLENASKFYEGATNLLSDETFDIGMYKGILTITHEGLKEVAGKIKKFDVEFAKVARELSRIYSEVNEEYERRKVAIVRSRRRVLKFYPAALVVSALSLFFFFDHFTTSLVGISLAVLAQVLFGIALYLDRRKYRAVTRNYTAGFDAVEKLMFSISQTIYDLVISSDVML